MGGIGVWLVYRYAGVSPAIVGIIFTIARIWDAVNDPLFGIIVDKSNPKKGKYKSWTGLAAVALPIIIILMFFVPDIGMTGKIIYVAVVYILWGMAYTVSDVPAFSLTTAMTKNMNERNSLLSISRLFPSITDALQWAGWIWRGTAVWDRGTPGHRRDVSVSRQSQSLSYSPIDYENKDTVLYF